MNQVATKKENAVQAVSALEEFAGQGAENITARDIKLPILKILYANSPVLDESSGKFNEKARQGDIYNEITGSLYKGKDGILVVPCLYVNTFNEWKDRGDSPGRPIAIHTNPDILRETSRGDDGKDRLENGNYVEDTGNHFVYILNKDYEPIESVVIGMKSTQKKKSKLWNSMIQSRRMKGKNGFFCPPSWATTYKLTTTKESNSQNSWYGWVIEFDKIIADYDKTLQVTKDFYESAKSSEIFGKVDFGQENAMNESKSPTKENEIEDDTPF